MDLGYHPSVADKLFLELNRSHFSYLVTNKNLEPLKGGRYELIDADLLKNIFNTNPIFQQIFAATQLTLRGADFVLLPQEISSKENKLNLFELNYDLDDQSQLESGFIGNTIEIVYRCPKDILELIKEKFLNLKLNHELEPLCQCWFGRAVNHHSNDIYASISESKLLLSIRSKGTIIFANMFDVATIEDLFYYVMLSVEQLELDIEQANLFWVIEDLNFNIEEVKQRFKNYVNTVHPYLFDNTSEQSSHPFVAKNQGMRAVLQCAS